MNCQNPFERLDVITPRHRGEDPVQWHAGDTVICRECKVISMFDAHDELQLPTLAQFNNKGPSTQAKLRSHGGLWIERGKAVALSPAEPAPKGPTKSPPKTHRRKSPAI